MNELSKLSDPDARAYVDNLIIEAICFEEFKAWMGDVPAWFNLAKCWEEETGDTAPEARP